MSTTKTKKRKTKSSRAKKQREEEVEEVLCARGMKLWVMTAIEDGYSPPWVTTQADSDWEECVEKVKVATEKWRSEDIKKRREKYNMDTKFDELDWVKIKKQLWERKSYQPENANGGLDEGFQMSASIVDVEDCNFPDGVDSGSE